MKLEAMLPKNAAVEAMDDILPLFILCLARSKIRKPFFLSNLLLDWMTDEQRAESEGQVVEGPTCIDLFSLGCHFSSILDSRMRYKNPISLIEKTWGGSHELNLQNRCFFAP